MAETVQAVVRPLPVVLTEAVQVARLESDPRGQPIRVVEVVAEQV